MIVHLIQKWLCVRVNTMNKKINEFSKFIYDLASSLHAKKILYVGCYDPNDLSEFPADVNVHGITNSADTLDKIIERYPTFAFRQDSSNVYDGDNQSSGNNNNNKSKCMPYTTNEFDFVFAHKFFNHIFDKQYTQTMLAEMYRISSKYIVNFELFLPTPFLQSQQQLPNNQEQLFPDKTGHYCAMYNKWLNFKVKIISNVQMHKDIDPEQSQFTLVRKVSSIM